MFLLTPYFAARYFEKGVENNCWHYVIQDHVHEFHDGIVGYVDRRQPEKILWRILIECVFYSGRNFTVCNRTIFVTG